MFLTNRESCTVSKTKTRGQMKTQKKNAPSVCQYWRRGRTSGKWHPSWVLAYRFECVQLCFQGRVCEPANTDIWDIFVPFFHRLLRYLKNKPKGIVISQKTPECLKITGLMELLSGTHSGFLEQAFLPSVGMK